MPYLKAVLATFPAQARLLAMSVAPPTGKKPGGGDPPVIRLDGKLLPDKRSHALSYADWFRQLEGIVGDGGVKLVSDRTIEWKGRRTSIFSIELGATPSGGTP